MFKSLRELLESTDPLTDEALQVTLNLREETTLVDFKVAFHTHEEREWLEITKDVMAFANTYGGYLVFGVKDGTYELVGLEEPTVKVLRDPNQLMQKINRYVEPPVTSLRSRSIAIDSRTYVVVLVPASLGHTHVVSKDGAFKFPSGEERVVLRQGTCYVRRSAGNHLVDSHDLDAIISRRIDYFKSSLMDKIAKVVDSSVDSKVLVVSEVPADEPHTKFVIDNASDALLVKGMSFTVSPTTIEQEIAAWIAMTDRDANALPAPGTTWNWYHERKTLKLTADQLIRAAIYCLRNGAPTFFWLHGCKASDIKPLLIDTLSHCANVLLVPDILCVGAFLGKRFHSSLVNKVPESMGRRLSPKTLSFPAAGPPSILGADAVVPRKARPATPSQLRVAIELELDAIAASAKTSPNHEPELMQRWRAQRLDCYLYARDDQYV